ncbi:calmodulin-4-like protein [Tritrichomonas foetus]|uniref:Calmodulin-4-like protein n=1 Tax=Tritrichomonas foetus TaxID=1144522 RepID=A0A1J4L1J7_9EUKA|nr:calmodulin-4-like protein [Tritrichomonas foetus]|eukprot:OHT15765.1 calmodulin-4-like protein [Tritrichomonas foetus]
MKKPSPSEVEAIFKIADTDGNGTIEFDEFINAMQKIRTDQETEYRDIFNSFDIDGDGKINREELVLAFNKMGESLSPVEVDLLLEQFDTDGNGSICFNELCRMLKSLY